MKSISYKTAMLLSSIPGKMYSACKVDIPIRTCKRYGVKVKVSHAFQKTTVFVVENNLIPKNKSLKEQMKKAIQLRRQIEVHFNVKKKINEYTQKPESELNLAQGMLLNDEGKKIWYKYHDALVSCGI